MTPQDFKQKIYIVDTATGGIIHKTVSNVVPRLDEVITVFNKKAGVYTHWTVVSVNYGFAVEDGTKPPSGQGSSPMVATIHVKFHSKENQEEVEP